MRVCPVCLRDDIHPGESCEFCGGAGKVDQFYECPHCHGEANVLMEGETCVLCDGVGYTHEEICDDDMPGLYPDENTEL